MADIDLATILADGEYLKRAGDVLVGDIPATGGTPEDVVDQVAAALVDGTGIDIVYDDTANTITVNSTITDTGSTILDGVVAPTPTIGVVGEYYEDKQAGILYGPKSATGYGAEQRIAVAGAPNANLGGFEHSCRVRFARNGRITKIRYQRLSASAATLILSLWDEAGTRVAGPTNVTDAGTATFTHTLATPIPVAAGSIYTASIFAAASGNVPLGNPASVATTTDCTFVGFYRQSGGGFPTSEVTTASYFVEPIFEPDEAWPVTVRQTPVVIARRTIITRTAVSNTGLLVEAGAYLRFTGSNPTYTIPPNSSVAFPIGAVIAGIGTTTAMTLIAGAGVTLVKARTLVTTGAGSAWTAIKVATDTFDLAGDFVDEYG